MIERDYIIVSDLTRVRTVQRILEGVVPVNNRSVPLSEYLEVNQILHRWESAMAEIVTR